MKIGLWAYKIIISAEFEKCTVIRIAVIGQKVNINMDMGFILRRNF